MNKIVHVKNDINIQTEYIEPEAVTNSLTLLKLKDGNGKKPTSVWYNSKLGKLFIKFIKSKDAYVLSGNTENIIIRGSEEGSRLIVQNGKNVQFISEGGNNKILFENCNNTKAYGGKGNDYFAYMGGKNNTNYNMNFKKHTVKNIEIKFRLFSPTTWLGGYSQNLKSYYLKDGENKTDNTDNNNKSNNG